MNPVSMTIINPWKEYWPCWGLCKELIPHVVLFYGPKVFITAFIVLIFKFLLDLGNTFLPHLTFSHKSPGYYLSTIQVFLKALREKEKLLLQSNFSFSLSIYYPFEELSAIFIKFEIDVHKLFQFGRV